MIPVAWTVVIAVLASVVSLIAGILVGFWAAGGKCCSASEDSPHSW